MRVTKLKFTEQEQSVIEAALRFANIKKIKSAEQVEKIFTPLAPGVFKTISGKDKTGKAFKNDQAELKKWLIEISEKGIHARETIGTTIAQRLRTVDTEISFDGSRISYIFGLTGVQAAYSFAVALILDDTKGLTNRLGFCKAPKCGKFRLDFEGKPRSFCSDEHRYRYDLSKSADRVKAWRKRQKKKSKK